MPRPGEGVNMPEAGNLADRVEAAADRATRGSVSLIRYAPGAVLLAILVADSNRHTDPDLWGHIRFGQLFVTHPHLVSRDTYSYSATGARFFDHEWLGEAVMAISYNAAGVIGLKLWKFFSTAVTLLLVADAEASTGASPSIQLPVLLIASVGLILQAQFRPQIFTLACFSALLALLARESYGRNARLWLVVPLMALWANLHGGFFIGIAAMLIYAGAIMAGDFFTERGLERGGRLILMTAGGSLATLLNPYGIGLWKTVFRALKDPYTRSVVKDWQPLWFAMHEQWRTNPSGLLLYAFVIGMVIALALGCMKYPPSRQDLPLIAIAALMAIAAWISVRNLALAALAASPPLCRRVSAAISGPPGREASARPWSLASQFAALGISAVLAHSGGLLSSRLATDRAYPAGALAFMRTHHLSGNVLAEFGWGEYLIWHAAPADKIFIDGRYDTVYPLKVIDDYLRFFFDEPGADAVLDSYPHNFILIGPGTPARHVVERRADWRMIYKDDNSLLYERSSRARRHSDLPAGIAPRDGFP
jgi:hypothetical protein